MTCSIKNFKAFLRLKKSESKDSALRPQVYVSTDGALRPPPVYVSEDGALRSPWV